MNSEAAKQISGEPIFQAEGTVGAKTLRWEYVDRFREQHEGQRLKGRLKAGVGEAGRGQLSWETSKRGV